MNLNNIYFDVFFPAVPPLTSPGPLPSITVRGGDDVIQDKTAATMGQYKRDTVYQLQLVDTRIMYLICFAVVIGASRPPA